MEFLCLRYKIEFKLISLDENIGKLFDKLKAENLYDDSIIIFTTDNGANIATYGSSKCFFLHLGHFYDNYLF